MQLGAKALEENHGFHGYPTILIAIDDPETRRSMVDGLCQQDYNILEAPDLISMVVAVLTQSRTVLLLIDENTEKRIWALRLKNHKREMIVLPVAEHQHTEDPDVLTPKLALVTVRNLFMTEATKT